MTCQRCGFSVERPTRTVKNPTPFPEYFGQNVCVEPATARRVADFLLNARKEEEEMASNIRTLEASLAQMKAEHVAAKVSIAKHEALLSHVHRLPNEILEQIFLLIPGAKNWWTIPPTSHDDLVRWHLTWVCQQWRTVAIQATGLWNAINIWDKYHSDNVSPLLELSISRTRGLLPLLLDISTNQTNATHALILKHSAHIQTLYYRIYVGETRIPQDPDAHFESLEKLTVFIDTDREFVDPDNCSLSSEDRGLQVEIELGKYLSPFKQCASLETFDLHIDTHADEYGREYSSCVNVSLRTFPWYNISVFKLRIADRTLFPLDRVLAVCMKLKTLDVYGYAGTYRWSHTSLLLPELSTIRLENISGSAFEVLPTFNIPALQTLSLEEVGGDVESVSSHFCLSHQLSSLRLHPCHNPRMLRDWRDNVARTGQALDCFDLRVSPRLDDPVSSDPSVLPLAREVRLEFTSHVDGRFAELMRWVQENGDYLESLTLVFEEWEASDVQYSWQKENRNCDLPTADEMLEWAEDKLRRSNFMARVNSIACAGVNVEMIMKGNDGSETRVEDDYLRDQM